MKAYDREGKPVELADGAILPDGYSIRVLSFLVDGIPQPMTTRIVDAYGNEPGHRPGHVFARDDNEEAARISYDASCARMQQAWRTPSAAAVPVRDMRPVTADDIEAEREAYKQRISNAWRSTSGTGFGPGSF